VAQKVKGIPALLRRFNKFEVDGLRLATAITNQTAENIVNLSQSAAPVDIGQLRQSIGKTTARVAYNVSYVFANAPYAPFVEFGTGVRVKIPAGFEDIASKFKGKDIGNGISFLDAIKAWCKSKGIDEKAAYPIMLKLLNVGMQAQPFLIPAYNKEAKEYPKRLKKGLEKLAKDFNKK